MTVHLLALAPAGVGVCCLAADRRRSRGAELAVGVLMLVAMTDAVVSGILPTVWWTVLLLAAALVLVAVHGRARGRRRPAAGSERAMVVHSALGMIVMGALMLAMPAASGVASGTADVARAAGAHAHGGTSLAVVALLGAVYAAGSVALAVRAHDVLGRMQYGAMAASVALMSAATVV